MSKSTFLKGAIWLTIATFMSKVIGSVFRIPLQNIAGDEVLGIFSIVYPVYMSILTLTVAGIPLAISKLISVARAQNRSDEVYFIYRTATILGICFGLISFSLMFGFADKIAQSLGGSLVTYSVMIVSLTLIFAPYMAVYRGFFQGFEDMMPTAISQVIEQFIRVALILVAAIYLTSRAYSVDVVAGGVMIGSVIGVIFSLFYLLSIFRKRRAEMMERQRYSFAQFKKWSKRILIVSLPICFGALTMALLNVVDSVTVPGRLLALGNDEHEAAFLFGIYGRGQALVQIAVVFASALILPLIPAITRALVEKRRDDASAYVDKSLTFTHLTSWPVAVGLAALTLPMNFVLFGDTLGSDVIFILSASSLFTAFTVLSTGMLQGANREKAAAILVLVFSAFKVILNIVLVNQYGIIGAAISTLITYILLTFANLIVLQKAVAYKWVQRSHLVFAGASLMMGAVIALIQFAIPFEGWSRSRAGIYMIVLIGIGAFIYIALILLLKGVDRDMLQSLPFISKRLNSVSSGSTSKSGKGKGVITLLKKGLWVVVIIALLASIPSLVKRVQVEEENSTYEIAMPYEQFAQWPEMLEGTIEMEEALALLKEHGLTSMSIEPLTISDLVTDGVFEHAKRTEIEHDHPEAKGEIPDTKGQFIKILERDSKYIDLVERVYNNHYSIMTEEGILTNQLKVSFHAYGDDSYLFLPYEVSLTAMPLGYDLEVLEAIHDAGLNMIPRLSNQFVNIQNENHYVYELLDMLANEYEAKTISFTGTEVVGVNDPLELKTFANKVKELGFAITKIDFNPQRGMESLLRVGDLETSVIHLFSMTLGKGEEEKNVAKEHEKGVRGYNERNIRILYVNPVKTSATGAFQTYHHPGEAEEGFTSTLELIEQLTTQLGTENNGQAEPFQPFSQPFIITILVLLGAVAFLSLTGFSIHPILGVLAGLGGLGLSALTLVNVDIAWKGLALLVAVSGAVYAGMIVKEINGWKGVIFQYVQSIVVALVGAWLVISLLYGPEFLVKVDEFKGVKVLSILPVLVVGFVLFASFLRKLMDEPVRYWQLAIGFVVVALLGFYVWRTGNSAMTIPYELEFRRWLESVLYVRPRTSEFLIGFPVFVLGLYLRMKKHKAASLFITLGMLGFASMVGTFTHLHTALLVSLLRTFYGIAFGFVLGLVLIVIYRVIERYVFPELKKRWI